MLNEENSDKIGTLYIVATPIGNFDDISQRAIQTLSEVDLIAAEDTRHTGKLLSHFNIKAKTFALHDHNEKQKAQQIVDWLEQGMNIALVSDAGTPGISDPGFLLVRECLRHDIKIECLPGPTAFVPALLKSGFSAERFTFEGFLPQKKGRQTRLQALATEERTMIFYESPHRLIKTLTQFGEYFGVERQVSVSRELTKIFEETVTGSLASVLQQFSEKPAIKGEFVLVIEGSK